MPTIKKEILCQIRHILEDIPETRDNDVLLWTEMIDRYYNDHMVDGFIHKSQFLMLPKFDTVSRLRRILQREGEFQPSAEASTYRKAQSHKVFNQLIN